MAQYEVGKQWFFPQVGRTVNPSDVIELEEGDANNYMQNEPGLLKPVRLTTQAEVRVTREAKPKRTRAHS